MFGDIIAQTFERKNYMSRENEKNEQGACPSCGSPSYTGSHTPDCPASKQKLKKEASNEPSVEPELKHLANTTEEALKEVVEDPELAETMARAVKDLRDISLKLREEMREKFEKMGCRFTSEELQNVIEAYKTDNMTAYREKFALPDRFSTIRDRNSREYEKFDDARRTFVRAMSYEEQASRHENRIQDLVLDIEKNGDGWLEKTLKEWLVQEVLDSHRDGSLARFRETKVGRVGAKIKEKAKDLASDVGYEFTEAIDDIKYNIEEIVNEIKWKIGRY